MRIRGVFVSAAIAVAMFCGFAPIARANILIVVDKGTQSMTVSVDGQTRWTWPVSTGVAGYDTPSGQYTAFRMEAEHFSKEFDDAPMPHSVFFTQRGHAIHGSLHSKLGRPASHGCVRLSPEHAAELYALVEEQGLPRTKVVIEGEISTEPMVASREPFTTGSTGTNLGFRMPWETSQPRLNERPTLRERQAARPQRSYAAPRAYAPDYRTSRTYAAPVERSPGFFTSLHAFANPQPARQAYVPQTYAPRGYAAPRTYAAPRSHVATRKESSRVRFDPRVVVTEETYVNGVKVRRHYVRSARPGDYTGWR